PCLDRFQVEEALRTLIRKSCNGDAVASEDLYLRVRSTITRTTIITDAE
ncbi:MAG TPA: mycothiol system anti-sigma-R factor, partial [Propionibacteriaceae bacterium]|nr:mycothiol system anti-sigma-R factor [Propionibacteriaceae bacterium]